ncbi:ArsB/NhaD family transporter [Campylobacter lanienae]|uniref:ArsB/NhaD family transporter n=1 Tax=Campylobacter lanienae TaxID=75658 RepID=UPI000BB3F5F2|nr:ArsB/NhaD family transporter [Campylobacter lanienae]
MAFGIFAIAMVLIYARPFGLPVWLSAVAGALCALAFGVVSAMDALRVLAMVWDSTLVLVGLIIIAMAFEKIGFFDSLATKIISMCADRGYRINRFKFFAIMMVFGLFLATFLANDGAILILTPLVFALFGKGEKGAVMAPLVVFLIFFGFLSDFGSNALSISNLTNIISVNIFDISFGEYFGSMIVAQLSAFLAACALFWMVFGRRLPMVLEFALPDRQISKSGFIVCVILLLSLPVGSAVFGAMGVPVSGYILIVAVIAIMMQKSGKFELFKRAPFGVVVFSVGLFVMVYGVGKAGGLELLRLGFGSIANLDSLASMLGVATLSSVGSAIINNLPMVMLGDLALRELGADSGLIYAHLLGCNIGSKLTPIGSLATLLWLASLRLHGVRIRILDYFKLSFIFSFGVLLAGVLGLWIGRDILNLG